MISTLSTRNRRRTASKSTISITSKRALSEFVYNQHWKNNNDNNIFFKTNADDFRVFQKFPEIPSIRSVSHRTAGPSNRRSLSVDSSRLDNRYAILTTSRPRQSFSLFSLIITMTRRNFNRRWNGKKSMQIFICIYKYARLFCLKQSSEKFRISQKKMYAPGTMRVVIIAFIRFEFMEQIIDIILIDRYILVVFWKCFFFL